MTKTFATSALAGLLAAGCASCGGGEPLPRELVGRWQGGGEIIVTWCEEERLEVDVEVAADGGVTGTVGDAALVDARLRRNRGALGRALNVKTDWIVRGDLSGPVVAAEGIEREGVSIPFDLEAGEWRGSVHTTGAHVGGEDTMVLTAVVRLARPEPATFTNREPGAR